MKLISATLLLLAGLVAAPVHAQTTQPSPGVSPSQRLGSKALGPVDAGATRAMDSVARTGANLRAMVQGAGAAVAPQSGATPMDTRTTVSVVALLLGAAALGGGGSSGSTGTIAPN